MNESKWICKECNEISTESEVLTASNPFDPEIYIYGCPLCKSVEGLTMVCDWPGCRAHATITNPNSLLNRTCDKHQHETN